MPHVPLIKDRKGICSVQDVVSTGLCDPTAHYFELCFDGQRYLHTHLGSSYSEAHFRCE